MRWVQLTVPYPLVPLLRACIVKSQQQDWFKGPDSRALSDLGEFLRFAEENPNAFPPTGTMAVSIKMRARRRDGIRRNDGTLKSDDVPKRRKRAHRKTSRPTRHERRLQQTRERKERNRAERIPIRDLARDGQQPPAERKGLLARLGLGRPQAQDPHADV